MRAFLALLLAAALLGTASFSEAFYLPGIVPTNYEYDQSVPLKVNGLDSVKTQLPYDYYSLKFCSPSEIDEERENLGEILSGDTIESSLYKLRMQRDEYCKILCHQKYSKSDLDDFASKIEDEYRVNWIVDNLPAATKYFTEANGKLELHYEKGFPLGFVGDAELIPSSKTGVKYLSNHVVLSIDYHTETAYKGSRVVGFEVSPFSVKHEVDGEWKEEETLLKTCDYSKRGDSSTVLNAPYQPVSGPETELKDGETMTIIWTYDVQWRASDVKWASRWDVYLKMTDSKIHWFSIVNSIMIVLFLSAMIAMIMMRTLHRDFIRYNQLDSSEEAQQEETGWKLIYSEVFRPPAHGGFLSVLVGSGVQIFAMTILTLVFALLGFLSPANRGGLLTALLLLFVFMGVFAGYYSTRVYKMFKLTEWKANTLLTAIFFPGFCFGIFFVLNLFVWSQNSSGAVPFTTLVALLVLWFGISVPLVYLGSYFAFNRPVDDPPCPVNLIPRTVPEQAWYMSPTFSVMVGGILPFGAVFIEIFFIMSSVWLHQFYYLFGFLFLVFVILIITCAEITIVMCYFQLCGEDYHWWWRSFFTSGASAMYLFLYSVLYFYTKLDIMKFVPAMLYFGYMLLVSFAFFVLTGTIGFVACYLFVHKIYSSIKVD